MAENKKTTEMNFEEALNELEKVVRTIESGSGDLQASIDAYERGCELRKICEQKLKEAESRISKITIGNNGEVKTEEFNLE